MSPRKIETIDDVAAWQLCCGCGVCAYLNPDQFEMVDTLEFGRRPSTCDESKDDPRSAEAMSACPGINLDFTFDHSVPGLAKDYLSVWGPVLEVWEGYASDPKIRYEGASGGVATALALHAIEKGAMHGVLHTQSRKGQPCFNQTVLSRSREELLAAAGSRYAPASPCDGLKMVEDAPNPCVFIGKPCDVAATQKAMSLRSPLADKIGLTIAFFCAGTPSTAGTFKMIEAMGIEDPSQLRELRYRGRGWPGKAAAVFMKNGTLQTRELTYDQSWGDILEKHRQWRCYICPDHIGQFADVAVADAWHRSVPDNQPGLSLIIARTPRGREMILNAIKDGYLNLESVDPSVLPTCSSGTSWALRQLWGRLSALRAMRVPIPTFSGLNLFQPWLREASLKEKVKSLLGTIRRIYRKQLHRKQLIKPFSGKSESL